MGSAQLQQLEVVGHLKESAFQVAKCAAEVTPRLLVLLWQQSNTCDFPCLGGGRPPRSFRDRRLHQQ